MIATVTARDSNGIYHDVEKIWAGGSVQAEVIKVWSTTDDKWVYEAVGTVSGALPLTMHTDGSDTVDYKIYGSTGGVGDRTENLFDLNANDPDNGYVYGKQLTSTGSEGTFAQTNISEYINITPLSSYTFVYGSQYNEVYAALYDAQKEFVRSIRYSGRRVITFSSQENETFLRITYFRANRSEVYVVGDSTAPSSYIPYGYEVDMVSRTENLFDRTKSVLGYYINVENGSLKSSVNSDTSDWIEVAGKSTYIFSFKRNGSLYSEADREICFYDSSQRIIRAQVFSVLNDSSLTYTTPQSAAYVRFDYDKSLTDIMFSSGSTPPEKYQPYRKTITPIYIGSDPLSEDEYVDYGEQKVYRMIDGTLTPTDPPVHLPALPTYSDADTVIDYEDTPAPSSAEFKYKKGW